MTQPQDSSTHREAINGFLHDCCVLDDPQAWVPKREINDAYRVWCRKNGRLPISHLKFHSIIDTLPNVGLAVKNKNNATWICFTGIGLNA